MKTTREFIAAMSEVNKFGRMYGFRNGIHWATKAMQFNEIEAHLYNLFTHCSELFIKMKGVPADDFHVSEQILAATNQFKVCISQSKLRNMQKQKPELPKGTFRTFTKVFHWKGIDGEPYDFRFVIFNEGNDAYPDFKIAIKEAPHFSKAQQEPHRFHILNAGFDNPIICWDATITAFDKANAVMIVWAQNYKKELDADKERRGIICRQKGVASKERFLPKGTFRSGEYTEEHPQNDRRTVYIEKQVFKQVLDILGRRKPELGGMLGFSEEQDLITHFVFDRHARVTGAEYTPDTKFLDTVINGRWQKKNISLAGFVHSHPGHFNRLSEADIEYAARICGNFDLEYLFMPIVTSSADSATSITGFIVTKDGKFSACDIETMDNFVRQQKQEETEVSVPEELLKQAQEELECMKQKNEPEIDSLSQDETFARIAPVVPLAYMKECTVIGVGCGGARGFYEDMARCGVGRFILIDGDVCSRSNIASQNGYISEVGKNKACVVAGRLKDINDGIEVHAFGRMLDDSLSDDDFEKLLQLVHACPEKTILCAFTDSFKAQARCSRLAEKYGIPLLAAQHHAYGDTSEVLYWYPGVSQYTQEEILADRYAAYENGFENDVTSVGSPIFNTTRLNALCEKLALGIFLYRTDSESRYVSFLKYHPDRNLLLIRQKCLDFSGSMLEDLFSHSDRDHFDDVVWLNPAEIL